MSEFPRLSVLLIAVLVWIPLSSVLALSPACASGFEVVWSCEDFLVDYIRQLAASDLTGDGVEELILLGRNYELQQVLIYVLRWNGAGFDVLWKSPNLFKRGSDVNLLTGAFLPGARDQILVLREGEVMVWAWSGSDMRLRWQGSSLLSPGEMATLDGQERDAFVVTSIARQLVNTADKRLVIGLIEDSKLEVVAKSKAIGNIRSVAAGDLDDDGYDEIVLDHGRADDPGRLQIWRYQDGDWRCLEDVALSRRAVFGLEVLRMGPRGDNHVVLAENSGKLSFWTWTGGGLQSSIPALWLGWGLKSVISADLDGNGADELVVSRYSDSSKEEGGDNSSAAPTAYLYVLRSLESPWRVYLGQRQIAFEQSGGRLFVAARDLAEALGWEVKWDGDDKRLTIACPGRQQVLQLAVGEREAVFKDQNLEVPAAYLQRGSCFVPLIEVLEILDTPFTLDHSRKIVRIGKSGR